MDNQNQGDDLIAMTADLVSAFVSNNQVRSTELPDLIATVHSALENIARPQPEGPIELAPTPAVAVKKSITDDYLICLDDGKRFKSLKRHLSVLGMTPDDYRTKWGLPRDYPMVAPCYAAQRSQVARDSGFWISRLKSQSGAAAEIDQADQTPAVDLAEVPPKRRGRPPKKAA